MRWTWLKAGWRVQRVNPSQLARPSGFSHAVVVGGLGRTIYLAGQTAQDGSGTIVGDGLVEQFDRALANLLVALRSAGARPEHLVKMTIYAVDPGDYQVHLVELGAVWRRRVGRDYPAMTLVGVTRLFDAAALVELDGIAFWY